MAPPHWQVEGQRISPPSESAAQASRWRIKPPKAPPFWVTVHGSSTAGQRMDVRVELTAGHRAWLEASPSGWNHLAQRLQDTHGTPVRLEVDWSGGWAAGGGGGAGQQGAGGGGLTAPRVPWAQGAAADSSAQTFSDAQPGIDFRA
ncbi:MAG: hypothetical protein K6U14_06615 [Firmicutes bacterium]|nr:hypothetical protein [Alicyclobacillaceae bacterium]MCL6497293.1 hypothetical protein [Bacillota bacterium]